MTFPDKPEFVTFEGNRVATWNMGQGPDLVLIHGTPFSSYVWHRVAPDLSDRFRIRMFDLLGYGRSDKPEGDVSLAVQNRLMTFLFDHWSLTRPLVVAHDFGGATALRAHLLDGLDYGRLLLID
ncbi:MAG: alpha/beta fold hydrolase, partial [Paracoccaceae bacterium]